MADVAGRETLCTCCWRQVARRGDAPALLVAPRPELHVVDTALLCAGAAPYSLQELRRDVVAQSYAHQIEELYS